MRSHPPAAGGVGVQETEVKDNKLPENPNKKIIQYWKEENCPALKKALYLSRKPVTERKFDP